LTLNTIQDGKRKKTKEEFKIKGDWTKQSKALKANHSKLTDEDLKHVPGKENEIVKRMETRLGKTRPEILKIIKAVELKGAVKTKI
jgi:hypothetical protein